MPTFLVAQQHKKTSTGKMQRTGRAGVALECNARTAARISSLRFYWQRFRTHRSTHVAVEVPLPSSPPPVIFCPLLSVLLRVLLRASFVCLHVWIFAQTHRTSNKTPPCPPACVVYCCAVCWFSSCCDATALGIFYSLLFCQSGGSRCRRVQQPFPLSPSPNQGKNAHEESVCAALSKLRAPPL